MRDLKTNTFVNFAICGVLENEGRFYALERLRVQWSNINRPCSILEPAGLTEAEIIYSNAHQVEIPIEYCVHHKDWNYDNNSLDNLELITYKEAKEKLTEKRKIDREYQRKMESFGDLYKKVARKPINL